MYTTKLADAVTGTGAQTAVVASSNFPINGGRDKASITFVVTGGSARSVTVEGSPDNSNWATLGTAVTATGNSVQEVPRLPFYRANVGSNTGSTITVFLSI